MATMHSPAATGSPTPRIPPICGECGYQLEGLPPEGLCPECGAAYHPDQVVIPGWGSGTRESVSNAPPDRLRGILISSVLVFLLSAIPPLIKLDLRQASIPLGFAMFFGGFGIYRRWHLHTSADSPSHARLYPEGFGQRDGFGPCALHPWSSLKSWDFEPAAKGRYRLKLTSASFVTAPVSIEFQCTHQEAHWLKDVFIRYRANR